jgi:hypothetical protein
MVASGRQFAFDETLEIPFRVSMHRKNRPKHQNRRRFALQNMLEMKEAAN